MLCWQVVADLSSCFAFATLMASVITEQEGTPTPIIVSYSITAFGFLLFFCPLLIFSSLQGAVDAQKQSTVRCCALATAGISLVAFLYVILLFVLLLMKEPVFCKFWMFQRDVCHGNGICYGAGQCHCNYGYGPEVSYSGESLCGRNHMPCSRRQLQKAFEARDDTCCFGHGTIAPGGCACDYGYGPEVSDTEALCARDHVPCTASQLPRALKAGNDTCCFGHGTIAPGGCACDYGYGPEESDTEALCARDHVPCTASQLWRALKAGNDTCCFGHGTIALGGCACDYGYGPEESDTEALCARDHVPCTASQLQRALNAGNDTCCFGHGTIAPGGCACDYGYGPETGTAHRLCASDNVPCTASQLRRAQQAGCEAKCGGEHFPGSRLVTEDWGESLAGWLPPSVKGKAWKLCFSSFMDNASTPHAFHSQCDKYSKTLTVARHGPVPKTSDGGHSSPVWVAGADWTFGGYVRTLSFLSMCSPVSSSLLSSFVAMAHSVWSRLHLPFVPLPHCLSSLLLLLCPPLTTTMPAGHAAVHRRSTPSVSTSAARSRATTLVAEMFATTTPPAPTSCIG
eukprot:COSAG02_NODE_1194_length_13955_cov_7.341055_7_plen_571_part_00